MPISHKDNIIFVHIPKTGGGSVEKTLGIFGEDNNGSLNPNLDILYGKKNNKLLHHLTIKEIKNFNNSQCLNYKKVSFVRNPFDRMVSEYLWRIQVYCKKKINFKKFLIEEAIPRKNGINTFIKDFYKDENIIPLLDVHYLDQYKFLIDEKDNIDMDFIGKFENLEKDFKKIFKLKLINYKIHKSKSDYLYYISKEFFPNFLTIKSYRKFYDNETIDIIKKEYKKDLMYFNYKF